MDYEEKYEQAIKRAKAMIKVANNQEETYNSVITIFPELKESEDERIRKEMIFYFQEEIPQCSIQEHSDKMREFISWLKRQEIECIKLELKAGNSYFCYKSRWERADNETFKKGLIYKCNKDGVLDNFVIKNPEQHFIEIKDERIAWLEKQGQQKPADIILQDFEKYVEHLLSLSDVEGHGSPAKLKEVCSELLRLVKLQSKQEWSEEDEKKRKGLIKGLEDRMGFGWASDPFSREEYIDWLKSLRPQSQWKPSDEQMKSLRWVIEYGNTTQTETLKGIYEQLKKLRKE